MLLHGTADKSWKLEVRVPSQGEDEPQKHQPKLHVRIDCKFIKEDNQESTSKHKQNESW
jgi:type IV secretory pathway VirD2 relaxase